MPERWLCIHGHFYQPPRENPWLEVVEVQDSAAPFHDWNERVTAECYGPNAASRLLTPERRVLEVVSNYAQISFNLGPTLLAWMERHARTLYERILEADAQSRGARGGHGNAIAQAYNHVILPLASRRDKATQVAWGIADFRRRFGRDPEGMWLPECAVDTETLEVLAEHRLRFTVLSPSQALAVRESDGESTDVAGGRVDPTRPYLCRLPSGRSLAIFFYDGPISRSLAFEDGLRDADTLAARLLGGFDGARAHPQLLSIATDGETYGHHKKNGDEVLSWALRKVAAQEVRLTNYGEFLERFPPSAEVQIAEGSSWSCAHGIERWRADCGCSTSGQPGWTQAWRKPLRDALDLLRAHLEGAFEQHGARVLEEPWAARNAYVEVVLDRSPARIDAFIEAHGHPHLGPAEAQQALKLLEMQRQAMLMFTSCGWFFAELSGLETVQVLKYAARAIQLARELGSPPLEPIFVDALRRAPSNLPQLGNGAGVWEHCVKPSIVSLEGVLAHYAVTSHFAEYPTDGTVFAYQVELSAYRRESAGPATLALGHARLTSTVTRDALDGQFAVVHFGGNDVRCAVKPFFDANGYVAAERDLFQHFSSFSLTEVVRALDRVFGSQDYTLRDLFLDERRRLADLMLAETLQRYQGDYERIFEENRTLMAFLQEINSPVPAALRAAAELALSARVKEAVLALVRGRAGVAQVHVDLLALVREAIRLGCRLDASAARGLLERRISHTMGRLLTEPHQETARALLELLDLAATLEPGPNLWEAQNLYWQLVEAHPTTLDRDLLTRIGERLYFDRVALDARLRQREEPGQALEGPP